MKASHKIFLFLNFVQSSFILFFYGEKKVTRSISPNKINPNQLGCEVDWYGPLLFGSKVCSGKKELLGLKEIYLGLDAMDEETITNTTGVVL